MTDGFICRSGSKWAHVSCALWIPEVSIGCPEKMEPINKISNIPVSIPPPLLPALSTALAPALAPALGSLTLLPP